MAPSSGDIDPEEGASLFPETRHRTDPEKEIGFVSSSPPDTLWFMATKTVAPGPKRPTLTERNKELRETLEAVENDRGRLVEALSNAVMMLRQEDVGWAVPGDAAEHGLSLSDLQKWSKDIRTSLTGTRERAPNPHMRHGIMLRHSFIWDGGMHYEGIPEPKRGKMNVTNAMKVGENERLVFGDSARRRREHALFADGLYLLVGGNKTKKLRPVPLHEITETHRSALYEDEITAYRWTRQELNPTTGDRVAVSRWVFVDWYSGKLPDNIKYDGHEEPVMKGYTAFDLHANRPDGSPFGSPDAIAAVVWARIIRDLIMNGVKMQDALAMFAFKATAPTKEGQKVEALELAAARGGGNAVAAGGENDLVPLNTAGKGYDFGSIGFVVSTMAASLHLSGIALSANTALAGSSYGAAKTLDLPGRMAMQTRRAEHVEFDERLLRWLGAPDATAYFDNYDDATDEYRSVQAAMLMWSSGNLTPEAFRSELETIYGRKLLGAIPKGVIIPNNQKQIDDAAAAAAKAAAATAKAKTAVQQAAPDQGKSTGAGVADHASDLPAKGKK